MPILQGSILCYNEAITVARDGISYAVVLLGGALAAAWLAGAWFALPLFAAGLFVMYFFRDPERVIPAEPGPIAVAPADGRVVDVREVEHDGRPFRRISIFLSIFDVHVNRAPVAGVIRDVEYSRGRFLVASKLEASAENERNTVTVEGPEGVVIFRQIAGILARRIVFWKKKGESVARGERVGLIKFGSRVDVLLEPDWEVVVSKGRRVRAGSTILARRN
jgi:phosphatidylserine decarboxylase